MADAVDPSGSVIDGDAAAQLAPEAVAPVAVADAGERVIGRVLRFGALLSGGLFLLWTGVQTILDSRTATLAGTAAERNQAGRRALWQAGLLNLLSPHPWLFWATVLGPLTVRSWRDSPAGAVALVLGFYVAIVGAKVVLAVLVAGGRRWLTDTAYRRLLVGAGVLLLVVGGLVLVEFLPRVLEG